MRSTGRRASLLGVVLCLTVGPLVPSAAASSERVFHPRSGNALGMVPPVTAWGVRHPRKYESSEDGIYAPATYHGGPTMTGGVTVHTIFWAPSNYPFVAAPPPGSKAYIPLIQQYLTDVAAASTGTAGAPCTAASCNAFTVEAQYGWGTSPGAIAPGANTISYNPATDSVMDRDPYPSGGCSSPGDTSACLTDPQVQAEIDRIIQATPGQPRGLRNLWFVFLPPNVDECDGRDICGTNAFAGYHGLSDVHGHGLTIYAIAIDPIIEIGGFFAGEDPNGNPDAELALDVAAHEINEAMTDPEGTGWMDPNGYEVGDKCDVAPSRGTPLGYAPDGSPYNQVVNGHRYLIQEMWSNSDRSCAQASTSTSNSLPLSQIHLTQFSGLVRGNTENATAGIHVTVQILRGTGGDQPAIVATGSGTTAGDGSWSARLSGGHAVGDDRDELVVSYSGPHAPARDVILTGNGGDPFTLSGWTGWTALDLGSALTNHDPALGGKPALLIGTCFQAGVLTYAGVPGPEPANDFCGSVFNVAVVPLSAPVTPADRVTVTSVDNRAFAGPNLPGGGNLSGALVSLTVPVAEPGAAPTASGGIAGLRPSGLPTCLADLATGKVGCTGLVPGETYTLRDRTKVLHGQAGLQGELVEQLGVREGDRVSLSNGARTLTTLHVARLKVHLLGSSRRVAAGHCSPGDYWRGPLTTAPTNSFAGEPTVLFGGAALTGMSCPASGNAAGMPATEIAQTDDRSGGATFINLADLIDISPIEGEILYGRFTAVAQTTDGRSPVSLVITKAGGHKPVFRAGNVARRRGVPVRALPAGSYDAVWTVRDRNGDTREYISRFVEETGSRTAGRHRHG
jgi:hypothetical protein